jgi:hypothetical protein
LVGALSLAIFLPEGKPLVIFYQLIVWISKHIS